MLLEERYLFARVRSFHLFCNSVIICAAAVVGMWIILTKSTSLIYHYETLSVFVFLVLSLLCFFIADIGVYAAKKNSCKWLETHTILVALLLSAATGYAVWRGETADYTTTGLLYTKLKAEFDDHFRYETRIDYLQSTLSCCGLHSYTDWGNIFHLPTSCCQNDPLCNILSDSLHTTGCFDSLKLYLGHFGCNVIIGFTGFAIIQIMIITLSVLLSQTIQVVQKRNNLIEALDALNIPRVATIPVHGP